MAAPQFIYHIANFSDWEEQKKSQEYKSESLDSEGFIHCSRVCQLEGTVNRFFPGREDIILLKIDTRLLSAPLIYEAADDGSGLFPHAFGAINKNAIVEVNEFPFNYEKSVTKTGS